MASSRQLLSNYRETGVDWSGSPELEAHVYESANTYDALNRIVTATTPDAERLVHAHFNDANLLDHVEVNLRGSPERNAVCKGHPLQREGTAGVHRLWQWSTNALDLRSAHVPAYSSENDAARREWRAAGPRLHISTTCGQRHLHPRRGAEKHLLQERQVVSASNSYTYDAIYRLVAAEGREHIGQLSDARRWGRKTHRQ